MAISYVSASQCGTAVSAASTTVTVAYSAAVGAGSLLVVCVSTLNSGTGTVAVSDSVNGSYTQVNSAYQTQGSGRVSIWYFANCAAGTPTISITRSTSMKLCISGSEYTGAATASPNDSFHGGNAASGTAVDSGSVPAAANELLVGVCACNGASNQASMTPGAWATGGANRFQNLDGSVTKMSMATADGLASGNTNLTWTLATSGAWEAYGASFKVAVTSGTPPWLPMMGAGRNTARRRPRYVSLGSAA